MMDKLKKYLSSNKGELKLNVGGKPASNGAGTLLSSGFSKESSVTKAIALNHLISPLYGAALGAHSAEKGEKISGAYQGMKSSLKPTLKNDVIIGALGLTGALDNNASFKRKVAARVLASLVIGAGLKAIGDDLEDTEF